jgi:hypothetical protein
MRDNGDKENLPQFAEDTQYQPKKYPYPNSL